MLRLIIAIVLIAVVYMLGEHIAGQMQVYID